MYGRIESAWRIEGSSLRLDVIIPPNSSATVRVPTSDANAIKEAAGARLIAREGDAGVFEVGAGAYHFASPL
jgi:alpha-L-rhamnosidase